MFKQPNIYLKKYQLNMYISCFMISWVFMTLLLFAVCPFYRFQVPEFILINMPYQNINIYCTVNQSYSAIYAREANTSMSASRNKSFFFEYIFQVFPFSLFEFDISVKSVCTQSALNSINQENQSMFCRFFFLFSNLTFEREKPAF